MKTKKEIQEFLDHAYYYLLDSEQKTNETWAAREIIVKLRREVGSRAEREREHIAYTYGVDPGDNVVIVPDETQKALNPSIEELYQELSPIKETEAYKTLFPEDSNDEFRLT